MKNPMTLKEKHQALDDVEANHPMQYRPFKQMPHDWIDCVDTSRSLNFMINEYRRKPKLIERFINVYESDEHPQGVSPDTTHKTAEAAKTFRCNNFIRCVRLVEDPDWVESEPKDPNPWRPIIEGEWPECKPDAEIELQYPDGTTSIVVAGKIYLGDRKVKCKWRYVEDDK